eukprot:CAMPEP_0168337052 /NCGR_PEP_ID=MMETSP0213-20121227/11927_1 /TAXON_ID=151035 /ORGANISM="Euplotes harpa, Strain FSP1.4" /LENGTH=198 /DNA_ID=CAMNT_0008342401 /DNA_START=134 /DNA_END=727 /DNA_ORIENTATION=-
MVTESTIKYLKNNAICLKVYGFPDNEHKPFYNQSNVSGNNSTLQNSNESKELETSAVTENVSQDFSIREQSSKDTSSLDDRSRQPEPNAKTPQKDVKASMPQDYEYDQIEVHEYADEEGAEEINDKFDEMFIHGGHPDPQSDHNPRLLKNRLFSQSVYEKPKALMSAKEQQKYMASQPKDDLDINNSSGKKKKKKTKG